MREKIIEILNEICPGNDFENETAIIDDGIIDSLDIVAVISELMEEFDVQLGVNDLTPENFNSVDAIVELIENAQDYWLLLPLRLSYSPSRACCSTTSCRKRRSGASCCWRVRHFTWPARSRRLRGWFWCPE
ncbi:MAG: acyl carrier protein [Butyricicoccus sp.]